MVQDLQDIEAPESAVTASTSGAQPAHGKGKEPKKGIIYLSIIPPFYNVTKIRQYFGEFGKVGRVYLQLKEPKDGKKQSKRKIAKKFTEGWVEFERKSVAKRVVRMLNNKQVSTRKKSKQYDTIWSMKYLSGFKWPHLHERLTYERIERLKQIREETQFNKKKAASFGIAIDTKKKVVKNSKMDED